MEKNTKLLQVIAILLAVSIVFTIVTANIVSITAITAINLSGNGVVVSGGTVNGNGNSNGNSATPTTPSGNGTAATTAPSGGTAATTAAGGSAAPTAAGGSNTPANNDPATPANNDPVAPANDYATILANYTEVLDKAKADLPGFTKKEFQAIPEGERNITEGKFLASTLLSLAGLFMTEESKAEIQTKELGNNMKWYPINEHSTKGCLLTDTSKIKSASQETLADGNVKIVITLHDDLDPEPYRPGPESDSPNATGSIAKGFCGQMFSPLSRKDIDDVLVNDDRVSKIVKDAVYSLNYHDCTATLVYNPTTKQIVTLDQHMVVLITASAKLGTKIALTQELHNYLSTWDYIY